MRNLLLTSKIIYYKYEKILNIVIYSIIILILNIIFSTNIAECTPPKQHIEDAHDILYNNYKTYANFKEYMNSQVINDTPLILDKYEPLSITYLRTGLYILHSIYDSFPDKPENTEIISDQFYNNMLILDKNIVYNILENMAIINIKENSELLYQVIADSIRIEKERHYFQFTTYEMRDITLHNNGFIAPEVLQTTIPNYKIPMDLIKPWKLSEPTNLPDILNQLLNDIETKTSIYQNYYSVHDLPDSITEKIVRDTVNIYHNNPDYWRAYHGCKGDLHNQLKEVIIEEFEDYYLQQPHASKLQLQIYLNTMYYFIREDT